MPGFIFFLVFSKYEGGGEDFSSALFSELLLVLPPTNIFKEIIVKSRPGVNEVFYHKAH